MLLKCVCVWGKESVWGAERVWHSIDVDWMPSSVLIYSICFHLLHIQNQISEGEKLSFLTHKHTNRNTDAALCTTLYHVTWKVSAPQAITLYICSFRCCHLPRYYTHISYTPTDTQQASLLCVRQRSWPMQVALIMHERRGWYAHI